MNNVPSDLIHIISSFLLPRDLIRFRTLSKQYSKILSTYFVKTFKTTFLSELICPLCGNDWINNKYISPNDFLDIDEYLHYFEVLKRHEFVSNIFRKISKRDHLLCEECEDTLQESPYLTHYKLPHNYQVYIDFYNEYPWACIVKSGNINIWNQYNCISDQSLSETSEIETDDENNYYLQWDRGHFV